MKGLAWTKEHLEKALEVRLDIDIKAQKVEFNSKEIKEGDIFIALSGGARDGHDFIQDALDRGAGAVIASKSASNLSSLDRVAQSKIIQVPDTYEALIRLAKYKRSTVKAKYIAITGSAGKTSTKESTGFLLSNFGRAYYNKGSFNNHIGVPLSLVSMPLDAEFAVLEIGMNHKGEISQLTKLAQPDIAIITTIGEAHLEQLGSVENICRAKCEIFEGLGNKGVAILNADSPYFTLQIEIANKHKVKILTFSESAESADCVMESYRPGLEINWVDYRISGKKIETKNRLYGRHQAMNLCASLLAIAELGISPEQVAPYIEQITQVGGRGLVHKLMRHRDHTGDDGVGFELNIIDDAYNANPLSVKASLEEFRLLEIGDSKKVILLADMKELGDSGPALHAELKDSVLKSGASLIFTFGALMRHLHDAIQSASEGSEMRAIHFDEVSKDTFGQIASLTKDGSYTYLVKGSNSTSIRSFVEFMKGLI